MSRAKLTCKTSHGNRCLTHNRIVIVAGLRIHAYNTETMSYNHRLALLSSLELHLSLIAACLPFIGPSIARVASGLTGMGLSRFRSGSSKCSELHFVGDETPRTDGT